MLTPPAIAASTITAQLRESFGLRAAHVAFLPIGADASAAVYRVEAEDGAVYFLKLKWGAFEAIAVDVPAWLHAQGIAQVMAPLATVTQTLWASAHGFIWILYPWFAGQNGFATPLADEQWRALGRSLRAVHAATLPAELAARVPQEDYGPRWRDIVTAFDEQVETATYDDPLARRLADFWTAKRGEIQAMVERAARLGQLLRQRPGASDAFVLCHTDLHAGNVLLDADDDRALAIVDWDAPIFAPRERDLMFIGGGVGAIWNTPREETLFYEGYGPVTIDPVALSYYRYERIVEDLAAYGEQIFAAQGSLEDREHGLLGTMGQFQPDRVVGIAHRTYERTPHAYWEQW